MRGRRETTSKVVDQGFRIVSSVFAHGELASLRDVAEALPRSRAGSRHLLGVNEVKGIASDARLTRLASDLLGGSVATRAALKLADYVVTEAGFGADLGAEKFVDIKCRKAGFEPAAAVIVATARALKYHGGVDAKDLATENLAALEKGLVNLERHIHNVRDHFGLPSVVAINHRQEDTDAELRLLMERLADRGVKVLLARHFAEGGKGALELASEVVRLCEHPNAFKYVYQETASLWEKMHSIATKIYGAADITADSKIRSQIMRLQEEGYGHYPVCVAKTQYSFSTDARLRGAPHGHVVNIREVRLAAGAEFIVMICGDIMTMPGLPKTPAAHSIDVDDTGKIVGLF